MILSLIAAMDESGLIGSDGRLPWHLPGDLKRFRALTWGKPIVMGRKTWESIGRPLPGRLNLVVTRDVGFQAIGARVAHSLETALEIGGDAVRDLWQPEIFVIGGASLFAEAIPRAGRFYRTIVEGNFSGNVYFPVDLIDDSAWKFVRSERFEAEGKDRFPCRLDVLERVGGSGC